MRARVCAHPRAARAQAPLRLQLRHLGRAILAPVSAPSVPTHVARPQASLNYLSPKTCAQYLPRLDWARNKMICAGGWRAGGRAVLGRLGAPGWPHQPQPQPAPPGWPASGAGRCTCPCAAGWPSLNRDSCSGDSGGALFLRGSSAASDLQAGGRGGWAAAAGSSAARCPRFRAPDIIRICVPRPPARVQIGIVSWGVQCGERDTPGAPHARGSSPAGGTGQPAVPPTAVRSTSPPSSSSPASLRAPPPPPQACTATWRPCRCSSTRAPASCCPGGRGPRGEARASSTWQTRRTWKRSLRLRRRRGCSTAAARARQPTRQTY